jgi:predicted PurR-regulated permease PerM
MTAPPRREFVSDPELWFRQLWRFLIRLIILVFVSYFLWRVRSIVADVLISSILAFALVGPVDVLCRRRIPHLNARTQRLIATLFVFLAFGYAVYLSTSLMFSPFRTEAEKLTHNIPLYKQKAAVWISSAQDWYTTLPPYLKSFLQKQDSSNIGSLPTTWLRGVLEGTFAGIAKIVDIILIPVLAFYFVLDGRVLRNDFLALLPRNRFREALRLLRASSSIMRTYIMAQIWLCVIAGVVVYIGLSAIHMNYALILGLLAGVTRAIPIIGPVIAGIPIVLLAAVISPLLGIKVLIFFSALHLIESKLIMPKFIGHRMHLHAAVVIIVLLIGGEFFGLLGMFLAAPLSSIARVLISHYVIAPRRRAERAARMEPVLLVNA